jgi:hypothetical protein
LRFSWTDCAGTLRSQQAWGEKATRIPPSLGGPPLIHRIAAIHLANANQGLCSRAVSGMSIQSRNARWLPQPHPPARRETIANDGG